MMPPVPCRNIQTACQLERKLLNSSKQPAKEAAELSVELSYEGRAQLYSEGKDMDVQEHSSHCSCPECLLASAWMMIETKCQEPANGELGSNLEPLQHTSHCSCPECLFASVWMPRSARTAVGGTTSAKAARLSFSVRLVSSPTVQARPERDSALRRSRVGLQRRRSWGRGRQS